MQIAYPYSISLRGRTAEASEEDHVRDLLEQVLFTAPGERVNRPTFGTGLLQLVFEPNSEELRAAVQLAVQSALQLWLSEVIVAEQVEARQDEAALTVRVTYRLLNSLQRKTVVLARPLA
jgi:phage baseplate assembly protein W